MKQKILVLLAGIPGSGKSTFANKISFFKNFKMAEVISRDTIRFNMLKPGEEYFSHETEVFNEFVRQIQNALDNEGGCSMVIADATHLNRKSRAKTLRNLNVKGHCIACWYFNIPLETCLARNAQRTGLARVPDDVIRNMYKSTFIPGEDENFDIVDIIDENGDMTTHLFKEK